MDTDGDGKADKEIVVAEGLEGDRRTAWTPSASPSTEGRQHLLRPAAPTNYANAYLHRQGRQGRTTTSTSERGTIHAGVARTSRRARSSPPASASRSALRFNRAGDLFCTDQEGATWLPNGNPFDELLHIQKGRHYGFPPRHPKHLPDVIDEPSTFDYGPQHQSTCGFCFNEPVKDGGPTFGPKAWAGDALVTG